MSNLLFTKDHEWIERQDDCVILGITPYAAAQLGDVVFVELPAVGQKLSKGQGCAVVESTKAASDVYAALNGEVIAVNESLVADPSLVNSDPLKAGWFVKIKPSAPILESDYMDQTAYEALTGSSL